MTEIQTYLELVEKAVAKGNATEHTHRPALKSLIESFQQGITATNEPKQIACGAPDFIITKGAVPLGYIEAKDVGDNLDKTENSPQLKRYRESLSNLILTDYLKFRWYVQGEERLDLRLAKIGKNGKLIADTDSIEELEQLFSNFLTVRVPTVATPKELAERMASLARLIRTTIETALEDDIKDTTHQSVLENQMESFKKSSFARSYAPSFCRSLRANYRLRTFFRQEQYPQSTIYAAKRRS